MSDPERISRRRGFASDLLRAGSLEQPDAARINETLLALGVASAVLTGSSVASAAAAGSANLAGAGSGAATVGIAAAGAPAAKAFTATLLAKWIGIGLLSGFGIAGVAAVASSRDAQPQTRITVLKASEHHEATVARSFESQPLDVRDLPLSNEEEAPRPAPARAVGPVQNAVPPSSPSTEPGALLAAEVAYLDRARSALRSGQVTRGLSLLRHYERAFPRARLLPEVLYLEIQTLEELGRHDDARIPAQRLVDGFPTSPHASRARKLLGR